jgi:hypothetical protein
MLMVTAYAAHHSVLWTKPLMSVEGMAWGVRDDAVSGKRRGLVYNQCTHPASEGVMLWNIFDREEERTRLEEVHNKLQEQFVRGAKCLPELRQALEALDTYNHACYPADDLEVSHV